MATAPPGSHGAPRPGDLHAAAFRALAADGPTPLVRQPGVHGHLGDTGTPALLLVTDDRARPWLQDRLPALGAVSVSVAEAAAGCDALLTAAGWPALRLRIMERASLDDLDPVALPADLVLHPVASTTTPVDGAVALRDAVALAVRADADAGPEDELTAHLAAQPGDMRLLAAVDGDGVVRATAGADVTAGFATVLFVNTEPGRQGSGIGAAMTTAALRDARERGARSAVLEASLPGERLYGRLGFTTAGGLARFASR